MKEDKSQPTLTTDEALEEAIEKFEVDLKRLKILYEMFFTGAQKRQPFELRKQMEAMVRFFANAPVRKYQHRFQLNTLIGRYNTMCELWGKHLRMSEMSGRAGAAAAAAAAASTASHRPTPHERRSAPDGEQVYFAIEVRDPSSEPDAMDALYKRYLAARQSTSGRPALKLDSFVQQLAKQAAGLRETSGAKSIEFRVVKTGDNVSLKARVGKKGREGLGWGP
jgi:hypothetical protein